MRILREDAHISSRPSRIEHTRDTVGVLLIQGNDRRSQSTNRLRVIDLDSRLKLN